MHGLDADARTAIPAAGGTDVVAGIFFALAPFVECKVLTTHIAFVGCCSSKLQLTVASCPRDIRGAFWIVDS